MKKERKNKSSSSAFASSGFYETIESLKAEIKELYLSDKTPWVVGYSGGKDSTAVLQLIWLAITSINLSEKFKPIHVISTDTLVENPVVASWVTNSLETMKQAAETENLPIYPHRLVPKISDTFWVNLIGRGYPAPRHKFRWCTERLKIKPSNTFIKNIVQEYGETILVLGTRKAESVQRASTMERHERGRVKNRLSPNASLPNSLVYSPIEDWSNDDVWMYLMQTSNPWGFNNKDLLTMYQGASPDGECPLVIDTTTPSCGDSRFGCWVCTLVDKDKSMQAMIQNDEEKEWMLPLLELRNELDVKDDRDLRDFRRRNGAVQIFYDRAIPGPYKQSIREMWLRKVLAAQQWIREHGPSHVRTIELISLPELQEIRRIWVVEKHELEDTLPKIYSEAVGDKFLGSRIDDTSTIGAEEITILKELCGSDDLHFELTRELLGVERRFTTMSRRAGLFDALEQSIRRNFYTDEHDAIERELRRKKAKQQSFDDAPNQINMFNNIDDSDL